MNPSSILFVGLGGAGQRHLRIFRRLLPQTRFFAYRKYGTTPLLNPDFTVSLNQQLENVYSVEIMKSLEEAMEKRPDLVIISTPSSKHWEPLMAAANIGANILVEKPWSDRLKGFGEFVNLIDLNGSAFRISFQRRFHPMMARVHELIHSGKLGKIISATFIVGSYVPAWHKYEDWKSLYAVKPELGGGVLLTEIHEIDLAYWFFGLPKSVFCHAGNFGPELLLVEDTANLAMDYGNFTVHISLCFMQRNSRRILEISGSSGYISWDSDGNRLIYKDYIKDKDSIYEDPGYSNDSMFEAQASAFLSDFTRSGNEEYLRAAWASQAIVETAKKSNIKGKSIFLPELFSDTI
jgi:predicted dehydrogenase